jgi:peptide/nickel transport system substrate-binding protein
MRTASKHIRTALLLALVLTIVSLIPAGVSLAGAENNTFIWAITGDPGNDINTVTASSGLTLPVEKLLYSPLINYHGPDDIAYFLAESYEQSEDGKTLTYHLRKDVKWTDGEPFTAEDVVFTFGHIIKAEYSNGHEGFVYGDETVEVVALDDLTVEFRFPVYVPNALEVTSAEHFIFPKHYYGDDETLDNNPKNGAPIGTGPYKLEEYAAGQYIKFTANEDYFLGKPQIDTLIQQIITDPNAAKLALQSGEVNLLSPSFLDVEEYSAPDSNVTVYQYASPGVAYAAFNVASPRVQDVNLRKAVFYALNRDEIATGAYLSAENYNEVYTFLPPVNAYYTDDVEHYDQDLEKAQEFLALVPEVPVIRLAYATNNAVAESEAIIIQQQLKAVGITSEISALETNAYYDKLESETDEFEIYFNSYLMAQDPSSYSILFVSDSAYNFSSIKDETLDGFFEAGSVEQDPEKRVQAYQDAQRQLAELAVQYTIASPNRLVGVTKDIGGVEDAKLIVIYTFEDISKLYFTENQ